MFSTIFATQPAWCIAQMKQTYSARIFSIELFLYTRTYGFAQEHGCFGQSVVFARMPGCLRISFQFSAELF